MTLQCFVLRFFSPLINTLALDMMIICFTVLVLGTMFSDCYLVLFDVVTLCCRPAHPLPGLPLRLPYVRLSMGKPRLPLSAVRKVLRRGLTCATINTMCSALALGDARYAPTCLFSAFLGLSGPQSDNMPCCGRRALSIYPRPAASRHGML